MGAGSFPGVKRPECDADHTLHLEPMSKKEQSYTSSPLLRLRGLLQGDLYLYIYRVFQKDLNDLNLVYFTY